MTRINEKTARFAVVRTAFHGGGTVSMHKSLSAAMRSCKSNIVFECICGCAEVFPMSEDAASELERYYKEKAEDSGRDFYDLLPSVHVDENYDWSPTFWCDLKDYRTGNETPYQFIR